MKRIGFCFALLISFFSLGSVANEFKDDVCQSRSVESYFDLYKVFDVVNYAGGLTSEVAARSSIGTQLSLLKDEFSFGRLAVKESFYKVGCYGVLPEGEVDVNRWSSFYGFASTRNYIETIEVYDLNDRDEEPVYYLEILGDELWFLYDGWLYKVKRSE